MKGRIPVNIAVYARVSTQRQAEHGYSLQEQIDICKMKAQEMGADSITIYKDDGFSGGFLERPALNNLRDAVSQKLHDVVIIYDIDRLSRNTMHLLLLTEELEKNAQIVFINSEYAQTPEGKLFFEIRGSFATYERLRILERMNRGRRGKLKQGKPIRDSKILGYDFIDGQYVINEDEADTVRKIFQLYLDTEGGYARITDKLCKEGILSVSGKKFSKASLSAILHRQNYTGSYFAYVTYRKKVGANKSIVIKRDKSEWIPMTCPAIISQELFDAVQKKLANNLNKRIRKCKYQAVFQGVLYCGICHRKMNMARYKGDSYYICGTAKEGNHCDNRICNAQVIDALIWQKLQEICYNEKMLIKYIKEKHSTITKDNSASIRKKLQKIADERQAVMTWYSKSLITMAETTHKLEVLKAQETNLQAKLKSESTKKHLDIPAIVKRIKKSEVSFESKRNFVTSHIARIDIIRKGKPHQRDYDLDITIEFA